MDPSEIRRLVKQARTLVVDDRSAPEAFLLAYVAWEALKFRILLVGLTARGMTVATSRRHLSEAKVWRAENYDNEFKRLFGSFPSSARTVGKRFGEAKKFAKLRHAYVHGQGRTSPAVFHDAALNVINIVESDWEAPLRDLLKRFGLPTPTATDPLGRLRASKELPSRSSL